MVMEIPPAGPDGLITGSIDDGWQTALEDVGPPASTRARRQISDPAAWLQGKMPEGYIALQSPTYRSYALLRSNLASGSDADVAKAAAYGKRVKVYPLSRADNPPATTFVDAIDVVFDSTIPYDLGLLSGARPLRAAQPWIDRDRAMIDMLKSIGIEKGKKFDPDPGDAGRFERRHRRSARLARHPLRRNLHDILQRRTAVGASGPAELDKAIMTNSPSECLSGGDTRRRLFDGLFQRQAPRRRPVLSDDDPGQGS